MKKIIDNMVFDTATATKLTSIECGEPGDFIYQREALYRTKYGRFFLWYFGGPLSKYGVKESSTSTRSDEDIIAFDPDKAYEWLVQANKAEMAIELFPEKVTEA